MPENFVEEGKCRMLGSLLLIPPQENTYFKASSKLCVKCPQMIAHFQIFWIGNRAIFVCIRIIFRRSGFHTGK
ncbi:MAG TPA: hypothetical protein ACFYD6_00420 [Candidatus Brocadiia bacterium]|nr:hypothetical protein [Candidatus Brocadiales bacterium]